MVPLLVRMVFGSFLRLSRIWDLLPCFKIQIYHDLRVQQARAGCRRVLELLLLPESPPLYHRGLRFSHTLIENKTLSFHTDGGYNKGFFYGFQEASNKIRYFTLTGNAAIGITNLTTITGPAIPGIGPLYLLLLE